MKVAVVAPAWTTPSTDQVNEYGEVPPVGVAVQVTGLPAVAVPQLMLTARGCATTVTVTEFVAVTMLASLTLTETVSLPFVAKVVVKLVPVPVDGLPAVAVQVVVYG